MSQFYLSIKGVRQGQFKGTPNLRNTACAVVACERYRNQRT